MKNKLFAVLAASALFAASAYAQTIHDAGVTLTPPGGGVLNSVHDMNVVGGGVQHDNQGRVCAFCHSPHHALDQTLATDYNPLWSHPLSGVAAYTQYDSSTLNATKNGAVDALIGPSKLCMSCHDGTVAVDAHYGWAGTMAFLGDSFDYLNNSGSPMIAVGGGANLSNDHPIGFKMSDVYPADNGIYDLAGTAAFPSGRPIRLGLYEMGGEYYFTCATCHEVHNKDNVANTNYDPAVWPTAPNYLVYADQNQSALCTSCHNK